MPITQTNEVGEIIHLAKSGRLIVKLNAVGAERIKAGELLIDGSGRKVGRVAELLGPVKTPYASVITMTDRTSRLVGSKVDRKSTRLNSSHANISYAVFCLKKK